MPLPPEIESDIESILAEFGDPVSCNGHEYQALVSDNPTGDMPGLGGLIDTGDITIKLLRSHLAAGAPSTGDLIGFEGKQYRITRVSDRPSRPLILFTCAANEE